jgi:hypothetical protein
MQHATALSASRAACMVGKLAIELEQEIWNLVSDSTDWYKA